MIADLTRAVVTGLEVAMGASMTFWMGWAPQPQHAVDVQMKSAMPIADNDDFILCIFYVSRRKLMKAAHANASCKRAPAENIHI